MTKEHFILELAQWLDDFHKIAKIRAPEVTYTNDRLLIGVDKVKTRISDKMKELDELVTVYKMENKL